MHSTSDDVKQLLTSKGADLVGFADLSALPQEQRSGMPFGISVALKYPPQIIRGIRELPTPAYLEWYNKLNEQLDELARAGAEMLQQLGYAAIAQTRTQVELGATALSSVLPHKTIATCAGLGWIGKSALLVTPQFGSMIRLSSILTDAPLEPAQPIRTSRCGNCMICVQACPGAAILGCNWQPELKRESFFDAAQCRETALQRSLVGLGEEKTICGKCIEICPYTQRYLRKAEQEQAKT